MKALNLFQVDSTEELAPTNPKYTITPESCALLLFDDLKAVSPCTIEPSVPAALAKTILRQEQIAFNYVVDSNQHFLGLITLAHLEEQELMKKVYEGKKRSEITVGDCMTPKHSILALSIEELNQATVKDVLRTLRSNRQQYCLVVEPSSHQVRGLLHIDLISQSLKVASNEPVAAESYTPLSVVNAAG